MAKRLSPDAPLAEMACCFRPQFRARGGRLRVESREALNAIPVRAVYGDPLETSAPRRLWDTGSWGEIHRHMLERLDLAGEIDRSATGVDAPSVSAKGGGTIGPKPIDHGKPGTRRPPAVEGMGLPPAVVSSGGNGDSAVPAAVIDAVDAVRPRRIRPRSWLQKP